MNQPLTLPSIINDPRYDKRIMIGILHDLIPRRTSIEIECIGNLAKLTNTLPYKLSKKYGVLGLDPQNRIENLIYYDEHSISIVNYTQLIGLYKVLADMKQYCTLNEASGCHIHVDLSYTDLSDYNIIKLRNFFNLKCNDGTIESIFGKYTPGMMCYKGCEYDDKRAWVTYRSVFGSLEFRTAPMTFDYSTIVGWFIAVNKLLNEFEHLTKYNKASNESLNDLRRSRINEAC